MADKAELLRVPAFAGLPDDQIDWFLGKSQESQLTAGQTYVQQGDPADAMFVLLEGQFQFRGEFGGQTVVFPAKTGDVTGVLPFSRMKEFTVTGRALTDAWVNFPPVLRMSSIIRPRPQSALPASCVKS